MEPLETNSKSGPLKSDKSVGTLIELMGAKGFDALPSTSERTNRRTPNLLTP
jgi:hypothetical protein